MALGIVVIITLLVISRLSLAEDPPGLVPETIVSAGCDIIFNDRPGLEDLADLLRQCGPLISRLNRRQLELEAFLPPPRLLQLPAPSFLSFQTRNISPGLDPRIDLLLCLLQRGGINTRKVVAMVMIVMDPDLLCAHAEELLRGLVTYTAEDAPNFALYYRKIFRLRNLVVGPDLLSEFFDQIWARDFEQFRPIRLAWKALLKISPTGCKLSLNSVRHLQPPQWSALLFDLIVHTIRRGRNPRAWLETYSPSPVHHGEFLAQFVLETARCNRKLILDRLHDLTSLAVGRNRNVWVRRRILGEAQKRISEPPGAISDALLFGIVRGLSSTSSASALLEFSCEKLRWLTAGEVRPVPLPVASRTAPAPSQWFSTAECRALGIVVHHLLTRADAERLCEGLRVSLSLWAVLALAIRHRDAPVPLAQTGDPDQDAVNANTAAVLDLLEGLRQRAGATESEAFRTGLVLRLARRAFASERMTVHGFDMDRVGPVVLAQRHPVQDRFGGCVEDVFADRTASSSTNDRSGLE